MRRLPLVAFVIGALLPQLLADAAAQIAEERAMGTAEYWHKRRLEEKALGYHANADESARGDASDGSGMWEGE